MSLCFFSSSTDLSGTIFVARNLTFSENRDGSLTLGLWSRYNSDDEYYHGGSIIYEGDTAVAQFASDSSIMPLDGQGE